MTEQEIKEYVDARIDDATKKWIERFTTEVKTMMSEHQCREHTSNEEWFNSLEKIIRERLDEGEDWKQ